MTDSSLLVSLGSAVIAWRAKELARNAALLTPRKEAITHLRRALEEVRGNQVSRDTINNIREAINLSKLVFSRTIRRELVSVEVAASSPSVREQLKPNQGEMVELRERLESVINKMNQEAALA